MAMRAFCLSLTDTCPTRVRHEFRRSTGAEGRRGQYRSARSRWRGGASSRPTAARRGDCGRGAAPPVTPPAAARHWTSAGMRWGLSLLGFEHSLHASMAQHTTARHGHSTAQGGASLGGPPPRRRGRAACARPPECPVKFPRPSCGSTHAPSSRGNPHPLQALQGS